MRKISFKVRNIGSEKYLSYILNDDCEFDEELLDYLEENRIPEYSCNNGLITFSSLYTAIFSISPSKAAEASAPVHPG